MYDIRTGDDVADAQVDALADAELGILMELFEVLWLTPGNGRVHVPGGNMFTWDHRGISVLYYVLEEQREVVVLRVDRFPVLAAGARRRPYPRRARFRLNAGARSAGGIVVTRDPVWRRRGGPPWP